MIKLPDATIRAFTVSLKIMIEEKIKSTKEQLKELLDSKEPFNYLAYHVDIHPIKKSVE